MKINLTPVSTESDLHDLDYLFWLEELQTKKTLFYPKGVNIIYLASWEYTIKNYSLSVDFGIDYDYSSHFLSHSIESNSDSIIFENGFFPFYKEIDINTISENIISNFLISQGFIYGNDLSKAFGFLVKRTKDYLLVD